MNGLSLFMDFISSEEEADILSRISKDSPKNQTHRNSIQRFGKSEPYPNHVVSSKIPEYLDAIADRLRATGITTNKAKSITINQYFPGQAIAPHIDSPESGRTIVVLSLSSDAVMTFTRGDDEQTVVLPSRSVIRLRDEARDLWKHAIEPVQGERYSIVFRCSD